MILVLYAVALATYFLEAYMYEGFVASYFGFAPDFLMVVIFVAALIGRFVLRIPIQHRAARIYVLAVVPLLLTLAVGFQVKEALLFTNAVFAYVGVHPDIFNNLALYAALYAIPLFSYANIVKAYPKQFIFSFGITSFMLSVFFKWHFLTIFNTINNEDHLVEYATFFFYLAASILAYLSFRRIKAVKTRRYPVGFWRFILAGSALALFVIAFEEISWGQRLLGVETPEAIKEINFQDELSLHNIDAVFAYVYYGYLAIGIYGCSSWLLTKFGFKLGPHHLADYFKPVLSRWYLTIYFVYMIGYVIWRYNGVDSSFEVWEELAELYLGAGVFAIYFLGYRSMRAISNQSFKI